MSKRARRAADCGSQEWGRRGRRGRPKRSVGHARIGTQMRTRAARIVIQKAGFVPGIQAIGDKAQCRVLYHIRGHLSKWTTASTPQGPNPGHDGTRSLLSSGHGTRDQARLGCPRGGIRDGDFGGDPDDGELRIQRMRADGARGTRVRTPPRCHRLARASLTNGFPSREQARRSAIAVSTTAHRCALIDHPCSDISSQPRTHAGAVYDAHHAYPLPTRPTRTLVQIRPLSPSNRTRRPSGVQTSAPLLSSFEISIVGPPKTIRNTILKEHFLHSSNHNRAEKSCNPDGSACHPTLPPSSLPPLTHASS